MEFQRGLTAHSVKECREKVMEGLVMRTVSINNTGAYYIYPVQNYPNGKSFGNGNDAFLGKKEEKADKELFKSLLSHSISTIK